MKTKSNNIYLFLAALIWGFSFVAQSEASKYISAFTFNAIRFFLGSFSLYLALAFKARYSKKTKEKDQEVKTKEKSELFIALLCAIFLATASVLQQYGIAYSTVAKAGFITSLYIILVPLIQVFFGKRAGIKVWLSVSIATLGTYLLSVKSDFSLAPGDGFLLLAAIFYAAHILVIEKYAPSVNQIRLSMLQFFLAGLICLLPALAFEQNSLSTLYQALPSILYAGIMSCGFAYTFQIIGQSQCSAVLASLILSLEAVFALFAGLILLGEYLNLRELLASGLIFTAIILMQIKFKPKGLNNNTGK